MLKGYASVLLLLSHLKSNGVLNWLLHNYN